MATLTLYNNNMIQSLTVTSTLNIPKRYKNSGLGITPNTTDNSNYNIIIIILLYINYLTILFSFIVLVKLVRLSLVFIKGNLT